MEQIFTISDYQINVKEQGVGNPLLLLHSYWGSSVLFDRLASALSVTRRVICIDLPGHGNSGVPPEGFTFDKFAFILDELFSRLKVKEKISIIGHSMGGYVAMAYAAKFPEKVAALILMHSPVTGADRASIRLREREGDLLKRGKKALLLQISVPSNFAPEHVACMEDEIHMVQYTSDLVPVDGALRSIYAINHRVDSLPVLQQAQYPILIIVGKFDGVYDPQEQLEVAAKISGAEVFILHHSGHMGFMEEEDLVTKRLESFFKVCNL